MSDIVISEEQFFKILNKLFNLLYKKVRYKYVRPKKDHTTLFVYNGDNLRQWINPTYILQYYPHDESLWISNFVYSNLKKWFPQVTDNLLFFDFFKKWFSDKFNIIPKKVYIINQGPLSDRYQNQ
jgi:hypothetical protein